MSAITTSVFRAFRLPRLRLPRLSWTRNRRRQTTIDLIHASPHLLRDIGANEDHFMCRGK